MMVCHLNIFHTLCKQIWTFFIFLLKFLASETFFNNKSPPDIVPRTIAFNVTATVPVTTKATEPLLYTSFKIAF